MLLMLMSLVLVGPGPGLWVALSTDREDFDGVFYRHAPEATPHPAGATAGGSGLPGLWAPVPSSLVR